MFEGISLKVKVICFFDIVYVFFLIVLILEVNCRVNCFIYGWFFLQLVLNKRKLLFGLVIFGLIFKKFINQDIDLFYFLKGVLFFLIVILKDFFL